jgi:lysyl-tRNA synthetase class 2
MKVNDTTKTTFNDVEIDLSQWTKLSMREAIIRYGEFSAEVSPTMSNLSSGKALSAWLDKAIQAPDLSFGAVHSFRGVGTAQFQADRLAALKQSRQDLQDGAPYGKCIATIFEAVAESQLIQPTIIYDFPLAVSPLSKVKPDEPDWVERFEFYIGGFEVGNAFSELNDPDDQRARFLAQVADKDPESMAEVDEDYVRALGIGLPPTAGEGIGIDRLTMILTGSKSIRDVILFPLMRPHTTPPSPEDPQTKNS